jgi:TrmH family RNA methyltransferase
MSVESLPYSYKTINWLATAADARKSYGVYVSESIKHLQAVPPADIVCFILRDGTALGLDAQAPVYIVSESWFNRIKLTKRSQGVLAIIRQPTWSAEAEYTHWVVCDTIQNPGNLGAIIRSVSAFLPSALVVCCGQGADPFHPDCVRASAGMIHRQPVVSLADDALPVDRAWYALDPTGKPDLKRLKKPVKLGIILGSEGHGVRESLNSRYKPEKIRIATASHVESLNVAVTAGIIANYLSHL